ncbi:hypothetical protein V6Z11_D08G202600 [Gossypium hirsutum]
MDNDENDSQSHNRHLAGEGTINFLLFYALMLSQDLIFDNLHGHLRFDSLVETEVFLGIESSEDNQWIEDFSRGGTGIAFSSSAAESCSISRCNNVWSEAASSESVEMLLKSVGQDETIPVQTISKNSDACDELGCLINQMEPTLKHGDGGLSKVGDDLQPALQSGEFPGKLPGLKDDVGGDHLLVEDLNTRNTDLPVTKRDDSKEHSVNENLVEASVDQSVDDREQEDKCTGSQVDAVIHSVQNTYASNALIDSQDTTHLKHDLIDENVDGSASQNVDLSQEIQTDGQNVSENAVHSKEDGHAIGNITTAGEPVDRISKGNSNLHGGREHGSEVSNMDTRNSMSLESNMDSTVQIACDALEKKDSSKSEKSLVVDDNGSKREGEGSHNTLGTEPMKECEESIVVEHSDDYKSDQTNTDCGEGGSVPVIKGVDFSSSGTVECVLSPSGKDLPAATAAVSDQNKVQVSSSETSFSIMNTSGMTSEKGAPCETSGQSSCSKVDQSLSMEGTSIDEGQHGDQAIHGLSVEVVRDKHVSSIVSDSTVRGTDGAEAQVISKSGSSEAAGAVSIQQNNQTSTSSSPSTSRNLPLLSFCPSESQTKIHMMGSGSSSDLDNPSCGSPIVIRTSEQFPSKIGNDDLKGSRVPPLADLSGKEAGKNLQLFSTMQHDTISSVKGTQSTASLSKVGTKAAQEVSHANLQASESENVRGRSKGTSEGSGSKGTSERRARRGIVAKEMTPASRSKRSASLSSAGIGQLVQSNEVKHSGHMEGATTKPFGPFTDLQQVQLRAQIFQGTAPDEAYMISAFGGLDGGRTMWENAWRACIDRVHSQKSLVSPETPMQTPLGAKSSDQSVKRNALQNKVTSSPVSRSTSKGTPTTIVNQCAVMDYQQALSPLRPPPIRNFVGHNAPWMSQLLLDARFPVLPITETVNLTPAREASVPHSSAMKQASTVPMVQSGCPANVFAGTPLLDTKKATATRGQHSAYPKPRKRKKSTVSEDPGQIKPHSQSESVSATVATSNVSTPAAITTLATVVSKSSTDKFVTSVPVDHLENGEQDSDQRVALSEETFGKLQEAQKQAEDASALAAAAVHHSQEIWNQLGKHKNSGLEPDFETELTSTAVAIAAASVAKAAAAAAKVASNAALQAKLMADEALVSSGYKNSKLGKATPASILRGENATSSSNSIIIAAREAARRRVEAASAASKRAENMDAIVKAAELAAEAVSQAGKIVAMGEPFPLTELVKLREKQSVEYGMSPTLREIARESIEDHSRLTGGILGPTAASGKDKKGPKGRKASEIAKTKGVTSESEIGFGRLPLKLYLMEICGVVVLRDGDGLKVAWFPADILDLKDGKAYVCYNELRSEDGDKLKEWVELEGEGNRAPRIRTVRPVTAMPFEGTRKRRRAAMAKLVGGVVTEKSQTDETSFMFTFLVSRGETSVVKAWLLRLLIWKNGSWVEGSSFQDNNGSSHEGDTPQEKRPRIGGPVESWKPGDMRLLDLSDNEKIFNIGRSTRDENKPDSLKMVRTGLKKEGSREKKRKFMEVSKHYVADQSVLKSGKPPSVSSRTIHKDSLSNTLVSEPGDSAAAVFGKLAKIEEEKGSNDNSMKTVSEVEPRRSNRRIQPTSRLLEGLQSSLIISKIPSVRMTEVTKVKE